MDKWATMHAYRHAVANEKAAPIKCPDCNDELYVVVGKEDEPALKCFYCRTVMYPGLDVWNQITKALKEINDN